MKFATQILPLLNFLGAILAERSRAVILLRSKLFGVDSPEFESRQAKDGELN